MKILTGIQQGTPEWHEARANRFGASEAPAMMGESKYKTRAELLREKATGAVEDIPPAKQCLFDRGHEAEEATRRSVEADIDQELFPVTAVHDEYDWLLASLDGITANGEVIWEHKLWNEDLARQVNSDPFGAGLEPHYYWQLEHELFVSGAKRALFTCSDGTKGKCTSTEYTSRPERRKALLAGWEQFKRDLAEYQGAEAAPEAVGAPPDRLPALHIEVSGKVLASNIDAYRDHALAVIEGINRDLQTDQDFADAEQTVKWCKEVEDRLKGAKESAIAQTTSIDELFCTIDAVSDKLRQTRLELDRLVKARKQAIRDEILAEGKEAFAEHVRGLEASLSDKKPVSLGLEAPDFAGAMKGKKTVKSLRDAADGALAKGKIAANERAEFLRANLKRFAELAGDHRELFADWSTLIDKAPDDLEAAIKLRIAALEKAEAARREAAHKREKPAAADIPAEAQNEAAEVQVLDPTSQEMNGTQPTLSSELSQWAVEYNVGGVQFGRLLAILRDHGITLEDAA